MSGDGPLFLDENRIREVLSYDTLIPAIRQALIDFSAGRVLQPVRSVMNVAAHGGWFAVMPAVYGGVMGAKLVTFYPRNAQLGKPTHTAMIQLFRADTGEPIAVLDGRLITEMRTAATSAVAVDCLASPQASVLAILGSGVQARSHLDAMRRVRSFKEVRVWSRTRDNALRFADETGAKATTAERAVEGADVVVTVTSSSEPVLLGKWLKPGAMVCAVGAVTPERRELDSDSMRGTVVVESREAAAKESGDIRLAQATIAAELGEILAGKQIERTDAPIVFKSLGIAVEDIAAARLACEKSHASMLG